MSEISTSPDALTTIPIFSDLHILTVLSQTRNYTQAAQRLNISKTTVSLRIAALERAAGVALVHRSTRSVTLTSAGQMLVDEISTPFRNITQSFSSIKDFASVPRGLVRLTAPVALGRQFVMPALTRFLAAYPEIQIELDLNDQLSNLANDGFDLAIRHTTSPPENYVAWPLCTSRSLLVASRDYLARRGTPQHPTDLAEHDCLPYLRGKALQHEWVLERVNSDGDEANVLVPVRGPLKTNNSEAIRAAAVAGLGIALLPDFSVINSEAELQPLVQVLPDWRVRGFFGEQIYALRPWAPQVPRAVQCLVNHLKDEFQSGFLLPVA